MKGESRGKRKEGDDQGSVMMNEEGRKVEEKMEDEEREKSSENG